MARLLTPPPPVIWGAFGALVAALPALWMWGFTVDDALISVRYARHLAAGLGWRFNAGGPTSDGVTPLPWPPVLALLARGAALQVLGRAKLAGWIAWLVSGVLLGVAIGRVERAPVWARSTVLLAVALSIPLAAYAVSGMETAFATLLATGAAVSGGRPRLLAALAGLTAAWRPELAPWACVLAVAVAIAARAGTPEVAAVASLALAPFAGCALVRAAVWGRPAPLAVLAKPSDFAHGIAYAGAAVVVAVVPVLVLAPFALRRNPRATAIVVAATVHVGAIVAVGGDWMPYARLLVPIVPSLAYAGALVAADASPAVAAARCALTLALGGYFWMRGGTDGRSVGADRSALVAEARPWLATARRIAAIDVGWVSAATEADIVDLAGVTDLAIAALPGGHTSKRVGAIFLLDRDPDVLLLYAPTGLPDGRLDQWRDALYTRALEARLADDDVVARHFAPATWLPLGTKGGGYVVLLRSPESSE